MIPGKLSLVLPAHNEAENIQTVIDDAMSTIPRFAESHEIIVVDDGSLDKTGALAKRLANDLPEVRVVSHQTNRGYGAALRSGFSASTGDWVMVMDSDRQFDIGDLVYLAPLTESFDLIAGYRIQRSDPFHRTLFGKTFRLAMRIVFGIQLRDIDCAFKLMRGEILRSLPLESNGAMISTELMARWMKLGASWAQVGVHHYPRIAGQQSGGSLRVITRAMRDVPALWWKLRRGDTTQQSEVKTHRSESASFRIGSASLAAALALLLLAIVVLGRILRRR